MAEKSRTSGRSDSNRSGHDEGEPTSRDLAGSVEPGTDRRASIDELSFH